MYYQQPQPGYPYYQQYPQQQQQQPYQTDPYQQQQQAQAQQAAYQYPTQQQQQPVEDPNQPQEQAQAPEPPPEETPPPKKGKKSKKAKSETAQTYNYHEGPAPPIGGTPAVPLDTPPKKPGCCQKEKWCGFSKMCCIITWAVVVGLIVLIAILIAVFISFPDLFKGKTTYCGCLNKKCADTCDQEDEDDIPACFRKCNEGEKCYTNFIPDENDDSGDGNPDDDQRKGRRYTPNVNCQEKPGYYKCSAFGSCTCGKLTCDEMITENCQGNCTPIYERRRRKG